MKLKQEQGIGDPSKSSPEKGSIFLDDVTKSLGEFIYELAIIDKAAFYE